jgi:hypothetical protein
MSSQQAQIKETLLGVGAVDFIKKASQRGRAEIYF